MNHADVKQHLADYLEGDLPLETRAGVDAHIDGCLECAQEVDEMQRTIRLLRTLPEPETPPMIAANVMRRIRAGEAEPGFLGRISRAIGGVLEPTFVLPATAVAAAALVAMVVQDPSAFSRFTPNGTPTTAQAPSASSTPGRPSAPLESEIAGLDLSLPQAFADPAARPTPGFFSSQESSQESGQASRRSPASAQRGPAEPPPVVYRFEFDLAAPLVLERSVPPVASRFASSSFPRAQQPTSADMPRARRVAQPIPGGGLALGAESSGGEDPRDEWLMRGLENPVEFARFLAGKNIAEHELWVSRLAERAGERGLLDDLVAALRESGDASAAILGDDFASQVDVEDADSANWRVPFQR